MRKGAGAIIVSTVVLMAIVATTERSGASSHREALAVLNEPCADNTDTYAWVSNGAHDKLYLIMDFNPLHEPGQGNQGLRACNGYRYEFHIGQGREPSATRWCTASSSPTARARSRSEPHGSARRRQRAALAADRRHRNHEGHPASLETRAGALATTSAAEVLGTNLPVLPNNHGPQTDRLIYGLGPFQGYDSGDPTSREVGLYDQPFVDTFIHPLSNGGRVIAGQFDDPYQLDEKGIFDLVNLASTDLGGIPGARRPPAKDVFTGFNLFSIALEVPIERHLPGRHPAQRPTACRARPTACSGCGRSISRRRTQTVDPSNSHHRPQGSGPLRAGGSQCPAAVQRRPGRDAASDALSAQQPDAAT